MKHVELPRACAGGCGSWARGRRAGPFPAGWVCPGGRQPQPGSRGGWASAHASSAQQLPQQRHSEARWKPGTTCTREGTQTLTTSVRVLGREEPCLRRAHADTRQHSATPKRGTTSPKPHVNQISSRERCLVYNYRKSARSARVVPGITLRDLQWICYTSVISKSSHCKGVGSAVPDTGAAEGMRHTLKVSRKAVKITLTLSRAFFFFSNVPIHPLKHTYKAPINTN